ncbi:hypothetical protein NLS1_28570 [Nocardioides sp. LS1]|nr:hypothetical protein NLS1_28570 [Nocardioides sp. LS1]
MSAPTPTPATTAPCEICWAEVATHLYGFHREWHRAQTVGHASIEERILRRATVAATDVVRDRLAALADRTGTSS